MFAHTHSPTPLNRRSQSLGAQVLLHQPGILQTAAPRVADRALLAVMRDVSHRYSSLCTVRGTAPPVLVHAMSNAGFVAFGTMLHLASLLSQARPAALSPAPGGTAASLEADPAVYRLHSGGSDGAGLAVRRGPGGGEAGEVHGLLADSASLAALSAFRQVLGNTQGIVLDSGGLIQGEAGGRNQRVRRAAFDWLPRFSSAARYQTTSPTASLAPARSDRHRHTTALTAADVQTLASPAERRSPLAGHAAHMEPRPAVGAAVPAGTGGGGGAPAAAARAAPRRRALLPGAGCAAAHAGGGREMEGGAGLLSAALPGGVS